MTGWWRTKWQQIPKAVGWLVGTELSYHFNYPLCPPSSCVFSLTKRCDSRCLYCGIWNASKPPDPSLDEVSLVLQQLRDLGVKEVVFSGGEPLLRSDIVDIVSAATQLGLKTNLLTNGGRLDPALIGELTNAGISIITVSLDSLDGDVYQRLRGIVFDRVKRGLIALDNVDRSKTRLHLTCVVTMLNLGSLTSLARYAQDHQMGMLFQPYNEVPGYNHPELIPNPDTIQLLEEVIERVIHLKYQGSPVLSSEYYLRRIPQFMLNRYSLLRGFHCTAGYIGINIDSNLDVLPCWSLPAVGNLRTEDLQTIWASQCFGESRKQMKRLECPGCWLICHTERRQPT